MLEEMDAYLKSIGNYFSDNGVAILMSLVVLVLGFFIIKYFCKLIMIIIYATKIDNAIGGFCVSLLKIALWTALFFGIASILGISGNSFLVAFSSIALAIGLALKDSLANVANGLVIIAIKPFKNGDHVSIDGVEGTIKNIRVLTTELVTFDNKKIVLPNSKVVNGAVINYTANPTRRIDMTYSVSYDSDMDEVKMVLNEVIDNYKFALKTPAPIINMSHHNASSIDFNVKFWVNTIEYWPAYNGINEAVFKAFKAHNIEIPYPQMDIHFDNKNVTIKGDEYEK